MVAKKERRETEYMVDYNLIFNVQLPISARIGKLSHQSLVEGPGLLDPLVLLELFTPLV